MMHVDRAQAGYSGVLVVHPSPGVHRYSLCHGEMRSEAVFNTTGKWMAAEYSRGLLLHMHPTYRWQRGSIEAFLSPTRCRSRALGPDGEPRLHMASTVALAMRNARSSRCCHKHPAHPTLSLRLVFWNATHSLHYLHNTYIASTMVVGSVLVTGYVHAIRHRAPLGTGGVVPLNATTRDNVAHRQKTNPIVQRLT